MKKIIILLMIIISIFYITGCDSKEENGKVTIIILDEYEKEVKDLKVTMEGVGEKTYPYVFEDLKAYQVYVYSIQGIDTSKYQEVGYKQIEAVESGSTALIKLKLHPTVIITEGRLLTESDTNDGSLKFDTIKLFLTSGEFKNTISKEDIILNNISLGYDYEVEYKNPKEISIKITGNASNHLASNSLDNLTVTIKKEAVTEAVADIVSEKIIIDFKDETGISVLLGLRLVESAANDGSLSVNEIEFELTKGEIDSTISKADVSIEGLPLGYDYEVEYVNANKMKIKLTGKAVNHTSNDDAVIKVTVSKDKLTDINEDIILSNIIIDFNDPGMSINIKEGNILKESVLNDGTLESGIILLESNDGSFLSTVSKNDIVIENLPKGMDYNVEYKNAKEIQIEIVGTALYHDAANSTKLILIINESAANLTSKIVISDIEIVFAAEDMKIEFSSGNILLESAKNIGEIENNEIKVKLYGTLFKTDIIGGITVTNLPEGLTYSVEKINSREAKIVINNAALKHTQNDNKNDIYITVSKDIIENANEDIISSNIEIKFFDLDFMVNILKGKLLEENVSNDGSLKDGQIILDASNINIKTTPSKNEIIVNNLPSGLDYTVSYNSNYLTYGKVLIVNITGKSNKHSEADSIGYLSILLTEQLFTDGSSAKTTELISVSFKDPFADLIVKEGGELHEASVNDGSLISGKIVLSLSSSSLKGNIEKTDITIQNLPSGFNYNVIKLNEKDIEINITGKAYNHNVNHSVYNMTIILSKDKINDALVDSKVENLKINFYDARINVINTNLKEASINDGSLENGMITLRVTYGSFISGIQKSDVTLENLPLGFDYAIDSQTNTDLKIMITGKAINHKNEDDILDLRVKIKGNKVYGSYGDPLSSYMMIDFIDPIKVMSGYILKESLANNGTLESGIINLEIISGQFNGTILKSDLTVINLPAGMDYTVVSNSLTVLTIEITGAAINHANVNDVEDLTVIIGGNKITGAIGNVSVGDMRIDFND